MLKKKECSAAPDILKLVQIWHDLPGLYPAAALMEVMNEDGTMARLPELKKMADEFGFKLISIADLIAYRLKQESLVEKGVEVDMPTAHGHFRLIPFRQKSNGLEHIALIKGTFEENEPVLVRVHSSCATGDIFARCVATVENSYTVLWNK